MPKTQRPHLGSAAIARTDGVLIGCVTIVSATSLIGHGVNLQILTNWSGPWSMTIPTAAFFLTLAGLFTLRSTLAKRIMAVVIVAGVATTLLYRYPQYSTATGISQIFITAGLALQDRVWTRAFALGTTWISIMGLANTLFRSEAGQLSSWVEYMSFPSTMAGLSFAVIMARSSEPYGFRRRRFERHHFIAIFAFIAGWISLELLFFGTNQSYNAPIFASVATLLIAFAWHQRIERVHLHNRNQDLLESLDKAAIIAITTPTGEIIHINDHFETCYGYAREEVIGNQYAIISSGRHDSAFWKELWETITQGKTWKGEICNRTKEGKHIWLESTINPLLDQYGRPELFLAIYFDITEQIQQTETLTHSRDQQSAMLHSLEATIEHRDRLVQLVAHDLRSPLANTLAILETLNEGEADPKDAIGRIKIQTQKALSELEEFLEAEEQLHHSRISEQHSKFDPYLELLSEIQTHTANASEKSIALELKPPDASVFSGPLLLFKHVCRNLVSNAVKYTPESGTVRITLDFKPNGLTLAVEDSGPGIPADQREHLFKPFYTLGAQRSDKAKQKSWGLGLSVVKQLITAQKGDLTVEDSPLGGAKFIASIPGNFSAQTKKL